MRNHEDQETDQETNPVAICSFAEVAVVVAAAIQVCTEGGVVPVR